VEWRVNFADPHLFFAHGSHLFAQDERTLRQRLRAKPDTVRRATTRIDPPTITHVIAMAAPSGGRGRYRVDEIEHVLVTAFTAFRAAVQERHGEVICRYHHPACGIDGLGWNRASV
jgi:hypothetical protein